jgi:hypothetical protein
MSANKEELIEDNATSTLQWFREFVESQQSDEGDTNFSLKDVEDIDTARENSALTHKCLGGPTDTDIANAPEWDQHLLEMHRKVSDPDGPTDKQLVSISDSATPEFVKTRIRDTLLSGTLFSDFDTVSASDRNQLREYMLETLTQDGWTIDGLADQLQQIDGLEDRDKAETIARTESSAVINTSRENGYKEQGKGDGKFYWTGAEPGDRRQTEACEWLIRKTNPFHGGTPVSLERLRELVEEAPEHDEDMQDNLARPEVWVVHPNERSTFAKAPDAGI